MANTLRWRDFPKADHRTGAGLLHHGRADSRDRVRPDRCFAEDARFSDRTVRWGGPHVQFASLPWEIGFRKAKEYLFTGDWIDAHEAERLGLVNRVVATLTELQEETMALAQRIALQDPFAVRISKYSVNQMQDEMGFRSGVKSAFQTHALSVAYRRERDGAQGEDRAVGIDRARERDKRFGDFGEQR